MDFTDVLLMTFAFTTWNVNGQSTAGLQTSCQLANGQEIVAITISDTQCSIENSLSAKIEALERRMQAFSNHTDTSTLKTASHDLNSSFQFFKNLSQEIIKSLTGVFENRSSQNCEHSEELVKLSNQMFDLKKDVTVCEKNLENFQETMQKKITETRRLFDILRENRNVTSNDTQLQKVSAFFTSLKEDTESQRGIPQEQKNLQDKLVNHTLEEMSQIHKELIKLMKNLSESNKMKASNFSHQQVLQMQMEIATLKSEVGDLRNKVVSLKQNVEESMKNNVTKESCGTKTNEDIVITRPTCNGERRHLVHNSCYFIPLRSTNEALYTWWDARYYCKRQMGEKADLAAIETQEESDRIQDMLRNHFGGFEEFWLSGNDLENEGQWQWALNGKPVDHLSNHVWHQYQVTNNLKNCMSMLRGNRWAAEPCFYTRHPICELQLD